MKIVDIHEAKSQLFNLVEDASKGEPFAIGKDGKPTVKVTTLETPMRTEIKRLGFLAGQISVPDDFDRMGEAEIEHFFSGRK